MSGARRRITYGSIPSNFKQRSGSGLARPLSHFRSMYRYPSAVLLLLALRATPADFYPDCRFASSHIAAIPRTNSGTRGRYYGPPPHYSYSHTQASVSRHAAVLTAFSVRKSTGRTTTDRSIAQREGSACWRLA